MCICKIQDVERDDYLEIGAFYGCYIGDTGDKGDKNVTKGTFFTPFLDTHLETTCHISLNMSNMAYLEM